MSSTSPPEVDDAVVDAVDEVGTKTPAAATAVDTADLPVDAVAKESKESEVSPSSSSISFDPANTVTIVLQGKTFAQKIHKLLDVPKYASIISWNDDGTVVTIHDVEAFKTTILPLHFKQSKFGSFIRRMRRWGFSVLKQRFLSSSSKLSKTKKAESNVMEFSSEHFIRDQPDLCLLMKDERQVKKRKFSFLERSNVRNVDPTNAEESGNQAQEGGVSFDGVDIESLPLSPPRGGAKMSAVASEQSDPYYSPLSSVARNDGHYPTHPQEYAMSPSHFSIHPSMPTMNMMSPIPMAPSPHYNYPPTHPPGVGFSPGAFPYQYPPPHPYGYPSFPIEQQYQQPLIHPHQQQPQPQPPHQQQEPIQPIHHHTPPTTTHPVDQTVAATATPARRKSDSKTKATPLTSSSEESGTLELLPSTKKQPRINSPHNSEH